MKSGCWCRMELQLKFVRDWVRVLVNAVTRKLAGRMVCRFVPQRRAVEQHSHKETGQGKHLHMPVLERDHENYHAD